MISKATDAFWKAYRDLPAEIKQRARVAYRLWRENPSHPSLRFKTIHATEPIYSVRIGLGWRAGDIGHALATAPPRPDISMLFIT